MTTQSTGRKEPGRAKKEDIPTLLKQVVAEADLKLYKKLLRMRVGMNTIEKQSEKIVAEGLNKEGVKRKDKKEEVEKKEGRRESSKDKEVEEEEQGEEVSKCLRNEQIVVDFANKCTLSETESLCDIGNQPFVLSVYDRNCDRADTRRTINAWV